MTSSRNFPIASSPSGVERRIDRVLNALAIVLAAYVLIGGIVSLLGWVIDVPALTDWDDDGISIQPNAAIAAVATASALFALAMGASRAALGLGLFVALIGASALLEWVTPIDLRIDTLLMFDRTWGRKGVLYPGRMGPPGSVSWTLLGVAIALAAGRPGSRARSIASALTLVTVGIAMLSLVGYAFGADDLYTIPRLTVIALQTSTFIFAASLALLIRIPERGLMALVREDSAAGMLVRGTVPVFVVVSVLIGFARFKGEQAGYYDSSFGTAARTVVEIFTFTALLWFVAQIIRKQSLRSAHAERELQVSQVRLAETLETIADGFVTMDAEWRFTYVNGAAERLLGKTRAELVGNSVWSLYPESSDGPGHRALARAMSERTPVEFDDFNPKFDRWFSNKAYPTNDGGLAIYFQDVTDRREQQLALEAKEAQLRHVADNAEVLVTQCSRDLRYVFVNRAYAELLHRRAEDIMGQRIVDVLGEAGFEVVRPHVERVLQGERVEFESEIPFDGVDHWMRIVYVPDRDAFGRVTGWIAALTNLTQRRQAERERELLLDRERIARADAERNARLKDEFLATISHELRTPLNAVIGWAHLLRQDLKDPERARHAVDVIERNARNQAQLIADLLDMSSITSGKMRLDLQPVDLRDVVRSAIDSISPAADARGVRIDTDLQPIDGVLYGDPARLQQIVWNLLSNAVKFTGRGGRVDVSVRSNEDHAAIVVRDTGEGLSPEFLPHVFDRFRQADASISRRHGGLGIGLALVKQFAELHGGSVSASSEGLGKGATFVVNVPISRAPTLRHASGAGPALSMTNLGDLKILLVDDDGDALTMMRRILEEHGAVVELARSADEGLRLLGDRSFDVMVRDIGMPVRDGYDLIADVRTRGIDVPALAVTAYASADDRRRAIGAGYQGHVAKPVDTAEFLVAVAALAGRNS